MTKEGQSLIPIHEEDELPGEEGDGLELTALEGEETDGVGEVWPGLNEEEAWAERIELEQDFEVKQATLAEVLEHRGATAVVEAVGRMVFGTPHQAAPLGSGGQVSKQDVRPLASRQGVGENLYRRRQLPRQWPCGGSDCSAQTRCENAPPRSRPRRELLVSRLSALG